MSNDPMLVSNRTTCCAAAGKAANRHIPNATVILKTMRLYLLRQSTKCVRSWFNLQPNRCLQLGQKGCGDVSFLSQQQR